MPSPLVQKSFKSRISSLSYNMNRRCLTQILQVESEITPVYFILQFNRRYGNCSL